MDIFNFPFDEQSCDVILAIRSKIDYLKKLPLLFVFLFSASVYFRTQGNNSIKLVPSEDIAVQYDGPFNLKQFKVGNIRDTLINEFF